MKGAVGAIILQLQEKIGFPYDMVPIDVYRYGGAGIAGWGTVCGAPAGAAAAMSYVLPAADINPLCNELLGWYSSTPLPTTANDGFTKFPGLTQSIAGNPLCHSSISNWCAASGLKEQSPERKERCAKLTADTAAKAIELLNEYFDKKFVASYKVTDETAECMSCHVGKGTMAENTVAKMNCAPCHGDPHKK